ncbi:hypothetical protein [Fibrobacter sp.]|uniref:hypothetical protein n=1 Tax=Fibrobacter sp. TaxID=35828 RepID=UPI00386C8449
MKYEFIYKVFKDYYCDKYVHSHLVGYFRSEASADREISYLKKHEFELGHRVEYRIEKESATLYPNMVADWEAEDREAELEEQRAFAPIPLPRVRKRFPSLMAQSEMEFNIEEFHQKTANNMMSFVRSMQKHRRHRR